MALNKPYMVQRFDVLGSTFPSARYLSLRRARPTQPPTHLVRPGAIPRYPLSTLRGPVDIVSSSTSSSALVAPAVPRSGRNPSLRLCIKYLIRHLHHVSCPEPQLISLQRPYDKTIHNESIPWCPINSYDTTVACTAHYVAPFTYATGLTGDEVHHRRCT